MPVTILLFRNYSHEIGDLLFSKLWRHIRRKPNQGRIQTFKKGDSTLELQLQPSCKLKTKKTKKKKGHHLLTIAVPHHKWGHWKQWKLKTETEN